MDNKVSANDVWGALFSGDLAVLAKALRDEEFIFSQLMRDRIALMFENPNSTGAYLTLTKCDGVKNIKDTDHRRYRNFQRNRKAYMLFCKLRREGRNVSEAEYLVGQELGTVARQAHDWIKTGKRQQLLFIEQYERDAERERVPEVERAMKEQIEQMRRDML